MLLDDTPRRRWPVRAARSVIRVVCHGGDDPLVPLTPWLSAVRTIGHAVTALGLWAASLACMVAAVRPMLWLKPVFTIALTVAIAGGFALVVLASWRPTPLSPPRR